MRMRKLNSLWVSAIVAVILIAVYVYIYQAAPLPPPWNDAITFMMFPAIASYSGVMASLFSRQFAPTDHPRRIWSYFALGTWAWALAEGIWAVHALLQGESPLVSLADLPWMAGYLFFAAALVSQYRLVFRSKPFYALHIAALFAAILILSALGDLAFVRIKGASTDWVGAFLNIFYPLGDLALGVAALTLTHTFEWKLWARPWIALLVFVVADALYTGLVLSGAYAFSAQSGNLLSLAADTLYIVSYLIIGLTCHAQMLELKLAPAHLAHS